MKLSRTFLIFGVVGAIGFGVDLAVLYALTPWLGPYGARVVSVVCAATATWWLNRRITFSTAAPPLGRSTLLKQYLQYLVAMGGGFALNYAAYTVTLHFVHGPWAKALGVAMGSGAGLLLNFWTARAILSRENPAE